jgi:hypothetical protein
MHPPLKPVQSNWSPGGLIVPPQRHLPAPESLLNHDARIGHGLMKNSRFKTSI